MPYGSVMVQLTVGQSNAAVLRVAGDLVERYHPHVIGIAACPLAMPRVVDGYVPGELIQPSYDERENEIEDAKAAFYAAMAPRALDFEWRSNMIATPLSDYIAREARSADLVIAGVDGGHKLFDDARRVSLGGLIMQLGRPMLVVPESATGMSLKHAVIGWKDTRQTRRATLDAVPLLKHAERVTVVELVDSADIPAAQVRTQDVARWLERRGVPATAKATISPLDDAAGLAAFADECAADLFVAGAYGHSRLREWVLGGVTRDLLTHTKRCVIVSH